MRLLLHICCAPCLIYPLEKLQELGFKIDGFFYNPNIHSFLEYQNRRQAVENYATKQAMEVIYPEYKPEEYFQAVNKKEARGQRCEICWNMRLEKTAHYAKEKGYQAFTTTLLVSPYQDHNLLRDIGDSIAKACSIGFYYQDFRDGFRKAQDEARKVRFYMQKYCGCIYSEIEREKEKQDSKSKAQDAK
ncbi:MAG: epoxyqueuosine reductase QueH [Candidatus Omnitrophica bacterium]|nr:epoxyqueuosine reductase QueH [Candidatus Omnitrophota bacterium]